MIKVNLFAYFREDRGKSLEVEYYDGMKIIDVVNDLKIDPNDLAIILINGKHQPVDTVLKDNDKLFLFPPVGGG